MEAIKTIALTKKYKNTLAVENLNLTVKKGELFALLGVNGAGKTTTVKMLCGLTLPDSGDAFLMGKSILKDKKDIKNIIGISPQETAVASLLTVKENLELMCGIYSLPKERIYKVSTDLGLNDILNKKAGKLSGGYKRRLSIALSLLSEPEILFLDEPTLGLDVIARSELWDTIRSLKNKVTVILTTHYMEEAEALSDRIGIMKNGRLLTVDTAEVLKQKTGKEKFEDAFISVIKGET